MTRRRPGRPRLTEEQREEARVLVHVELERQGWGAGEEPIWRGLHQAIPLLRVRAALKELKAERRAAEREHRERNRTSMHVHASDTLWSIDATQVGRDGDGAAVQAEVLRDVASTRTLDIVVGPAAHGEDVVAQLDRAAEEPGGAPLVLASDNGAAYRSSAVAKWCAENGVVQLFSEPRTPQHNAWAEHGIRELKEDARIDAAGLVLDTDLIRTRLEQSRARLDENRLRATRDWTTAIQWDKAAPHWSAFTGRRAFLEMVTCGINSSVLDSLSSRAHRRAIREAILGALERTCAITRTRGRPPRTAHDTDVVL